MTLLKMVLSATAAAGFALSLAGAASAGTVSIVPSFEASALNQPGPQRFYIVSGTPTSPSISADLADTLTTSGTSFTDYYDFSSYFDAVGSGSVSTSFSSTSNELTISDVIISSGTPGTTYTFSAAQAASGISGIPIIANTADYIEVQGYTAAGNTGATYSGTATLTEVSTAPEPAAWLLMIGGIAFTGAALRRRQTAVQFA